MTRGEANRREFLKVATGATAASAALVNSPRRAAAAVSPGQKSALVGIDDAFQKAVDGKRVPGVVAMAATDKGIIYDTAIGYRDVDSGRRMTLDTVFWIASMTKAVTTIAAMQLVEQGKLRLDQHDGRAAALSGRGAGARRLRRRGQPQAAAAEAADHAAASADPHRRLHLRHLERRPWSVREGDAARPFIGSARPRRSARR